jgi:hypothetical protein
MMTNENITTKHNNNKLHTSSKIHHLQQMRWHIRTLQQNATTTIDFRANSKNKQQMATTFNRFQNNLSPN